MQRNLALVLFALTCASAVFAQGTEARVAIVHVPEDGLQPSAAVDPQGMVHLVYFVGDPRGGDLRYVRSQDAGRSFSPPLAVQQRLGSAVAIGRHCTPSRNSGRSPPCSSQRVASG